MIRLGMLVLLGLVSITSANASRPENCTVYVPAGLFAGTLTDTTMIQKAMRTVIKQLTKQGYQPHGVTELKDEQGMVFDADLYHYLGDWGYQDAPHLCNEVAVGLDWRYKLSLANPGEFFLRKNQKLKTSRNKGVSCKKLLKEAIRQLRTCGKEEGRE